jgi:hypothetical protein
MTSASDKLGCYYLLTNYPADILCPEKTIFEFSYEGKQIMLLVHRKLKSVIINDHSNKIVTRKEGEKRFYSLENSNILIDNSLTIAVEIENGSFFIVDHSKTLHKEFYNIPHTELIVSFESIKSLDNYSLGIKIFDFFIDSYRQASGDVITLKKDKAPFYTKIFKHAFYEYTDLDLKKPMKERMLDPRPLKFGFHQFTMPFWNIQGQRIMMNEKDVVENLNKYLTGEKKKNFISDIVLEANEEFHIHKNYKYSFLQCWTAIETVMYSYVEAVKLNRGIAKSKIDQYEPNSAYVINIEIPLFHPGPKDILSDILGKVDSIRKTRNKVIHENKNVDLSEARFALDVLAKLMELFGYKIDSSTL